MAQNMTAFGELSMAIAQACGIENTDRLTSVEYSHQVGDIPRLTIGVLVDADETGKTEITKHFVPFVETPFAIGGIVREGVHLVGEQGPEWVILPPGSEVA